MVVPRPAMLGAGAYPDPVHPSYRGTTTGQRSSSAPGPLPHLYVTAFIQPISGETFWYVSNGVSKPFFAALLALFAREAGAGRKRIIVLELDNAGWHTAPNLVVPEGLRLVYLPPYSPELQPAEHLWPVLDEPLANQYFATLADLERAVADRCRVLDGHQLSLGTNFHWWPKPDIPA